MMHSRLRFSILSISICISAFAVSSALAGTTLMVGPGQAYATPEAAARVVQPGDTVEIEAGSYRSCAVWTTSDITIIGLGTGAKMYGPVCSGKGLFVVTGSNVTVKNIKFAGATDVDGNGAGIRAEGGNLVVENSVFTGNQDGILTDNNAAISLKVVNSVFTGNGACTSHGCAHALYAGHIASLDVENSTFYDTKMGMDIKSRALSTTILNSSIKDGPYGTSSYLVDIPNGGTLQMSGNVLEKGPRSQNHTTAISIGEEGSLLPSGGMVIENNTFTNDGPRTDFVRNRSTTPVQLIGNVLLGNPTTPLVGPGTVTVSRIGLNGLGVPGTIDGDASVRLQGGYGTNVVSVPEPPTWALMATSLVLAGLFYRGRRRIAAKIK